jgi:hypothetical protein
MALHHLPNELLHFIAEKLELASDVNALRLGIRFFSMCSMLALLRHSTLSIMWLMIWMS